MNCISGRANRVKSSAATLGFTKRSSVGSSALIDKLSIDEAQERLDKFFEILLRADLRTIERLKSKKENNENKTFDNA